LITFVARNVRRVVTSFPRCLFAPARGGIFAEFAAMPYVRFWHKADITIVLTNVAFGGKADMTRTWCDVRF
jgi:hypothetical protein